MPRFKPGEPFDIVFSDFAPDLDPTNPGIILDMDRMVPTAKGYKNRESPVDLSNSLPATPTGGFVATFSDGTVKVYAATSTNIYRLDGSSWTSVGSGYSATGTWQFTQFAEDVIAVAPGVAPQVATGATGTFAALGGSPPNGASLIAVASGMVFMARGNQWFNSAIGSDNNWTPNLQTLAATGTIYEYPGDIKALAPYYRNVVIFKERAIWLARFVGAPLVWDFQLVSSQTGTRNQNAVVVLPELIAFLGTDDFYILSGGAPQRIPNNLKEWFFSTADPTNLNKVYGWYEPQVGVVYWHFVSKEATTLGVPDSYVAWNTRLNRWAFGRYTTPFVIRDTAVGKDKGLAFNLSKVLQEWSGSPGAGFVKTGFLGLPGVITQVQRIRPKFSISPQVEEAPLFTVQPNPQGEQVLVYSTRSLGLSPTLSGPATLSVDGWHDILSIGRYHQIQVNVLGSSEIIGLSVEFRPAGIT